VQLEGLRKFKKSNDLIRNQTRDLHTFYFLIPYQVYMCYQTMH
jgi:hypothetical protein